MTAQDNKINSTLTPGESAEVFVAKETNILLSWKAPLRPFKKQDREFWATVLSIVFLLAVILFFVREWLLIAVMVSLVFVYYAFSSVPPEEIENQILNKGIRFTGNQYPWEAITRYWFTKKWGQKILNLDLKEGFPGRLQLLLGDRREEEIKEILKKYISEETPRPSFLDRAANWLSQKFPLEVS